MNRRLDGCWAHEAPRKGFELSIEIQCRGCQALLRVADEHAGKQARCPKCGTIQTVPGGEPQRMAPVEPPPELTIGSDASDEPRATGPADAADRSASPSGDPVPVNQPGAGSARATASTEQWYLMTPDGIEYGPVSRSELDAWVGESRVSTQCRLRRADGQWMAASFYYADLPVGTNVAMAQTSSRVVPTVVYPERHRGVMILTLGILGLCCSCPFLSIAAWVAGAKDLGKMRAQVMDPAGRDSTKVGYVLGMCASVFWIGIACIVMALFIVNNLD